jgi:hypothetical protein
VATGFDWNCWGAVPDYSAFVKSNATIEPASEFAMVDYLKRAAEVEWRCNSWTGPRSALLDLDVF